MPELYLPHHEMILVEGDIFTMGDDQGEDNDEKPAHKVKLDDFQLGKYPVTQALWQAVMGEGHNPSYFRGDNRPVENVSWEDTQIFLERLREYTGQAYRLPTEAEWEFAARGGRRRQGFQFAGSDKLKEVGWYSKNSYGETKPVGLKSPNELELYDMSGNVWEWCQDWFDEKYYERCKKEGVVVNPSGPKGGSDRVGRGGGWGLPAGGCRVTNRGNGSPGIRGGHLGFRLASSLQSAG